MKKFILSIIVFIGGILLTCATLIAEGLRICGDNAAVPGLYKTLFSGQDVGFSGVFLALGLLTALIGLIASIVCICKDKKDE